MDQTTLLGSTGATIILIAFFMNQTNRWKNDDLIYDLFNLIGGALLVTYAIILKSYPFLVLNAVWTIVSLKDVIIDLKK